MTTWKRAKRCLADNGKHRWRYAKDRTSRVCQKCGTIQHRQQASKG